MFTVFLQLSLQKDDLEGNYTDSWAAPCEIRICRCGVGPKNCISDKFAGGADAAGARTSVKSCRAVETHRTGLYCLLGF